MSMYLIGYQDTPIYLGSLLDIKLHIQKTEPLLLIILPEEYHGPLLS